MLKHLFTGIDNATFDLGRVLWGIMGAGFVFLSGWHVGHGGAFDPVSWGTGAAGLLAGGGIGIAAKSKTEPGG